MQPRSHLSTKATEDQSKNRPRTIHSPRDIHGEGDRSAAAGLPRAASPSPHQRRSSGTRG